MIEFISLARKVDGLRELCRQNTGSEEIREISVDLPSPPLDELFFRKAVAWCYVLFQETGPFLGFSGQLLRARNSNAHERFGKLKRLVDCARTAHAHNLVSDNSRDIGKRRQYDIWLKENGGDPIDWEKCSLALMAEALQVTSDIDAEWRTRSEHESDRQEIWTSYKSEKDTTWDAHEFDRFVDQTAEELKLSGFNSTLFRKEGNRLERWRQLIPLFKSREEAEAAVLRAVRSEMIAMFGTA